jgi:rubrerythrin
VAREAEAHRRLLAFARKAAEEGYPQVAKLFRAVSVAEGVHADNHLRILGEAVVRDTQANLNFSFETEKRCAPSVGQKTSYFAGLSDIWTHYEVEDNTAEPRADPQK